MRKLITLSAALVVGAALSAPVHAAMQASGYSRSENQHTVFEHAQYELYFNNSGGALTSGTVVILDVSGTGVNTVNSDVEGGPTSASRSVIDTQGSDGDVTNIGTYITTSTTADVDTVAGVVDDDSCANQTYCRVQTAGPRLVRCAGSSDAVTASAVVGQANGVAGQCGAGSGLGVALEATAASGEDDDLIWVDIRIGMGSN